MLLLVLVLVLAMVGCGGVQPSASIGGTNVPATLRCAEDEVIAFVNVDTLNCVHIDRLEID